ncbi:nitrous oxide-stimulated promoter family protein [Eggerthellaceae bacterium zg-1084]|uniref:nitrous oxide-stimulated promoter family protein n=1 Tax=Berryella wangjianweii TaxID=2734634 RepID=UPI0015522477|nr:nitrous oxide-stimulated promoter family protein [Berryella wangjianweii]NPD31322.1 nitrous oxide-stimulated promoter family protein [Berryella wangjianweii]NPD32369.1 nitrous oxide-stimulated promoter family protein [Eggerthellaceae bacterium zg-997]
MACGNGAEPSVLADGTQVSGPLSEGQRQEKRDRELRVVGTMVGIYCQGNHGTRQGDLCEECRELLAYAARRIERCPVIDTKTFCSTCAVHCYAPERREAIRTVMRYAGPRMLLRDPKGALRHLADARAAAKRMRGR